MRSDWERLGIEDKVLTILRAVPHAGSPDAYGRPFISAYQLAIEMEVRYPEVRRDLDKPIGGAGSGQPRSECNELSAAAIANLPQTVTPQCNMGPMLHLKRWHPR